MSRTATAVRDHEAGSRILSPHNLRSKREDLVIRDASVSLSIKGNSNKRGVITEGNFLSFV